MKSYGKKVKEVRKNEGLSQDEFAEIIGVSRQTVYKWEQDIARPTQKNLKKISEVFSVSAEYFFEVNAQNEQVDEEQSVFYKESKTVKIIGFIIVLAAQLFVLVWTVYNLIIKVVQSNQGLKTSNVSALINDFLYFGSIILVLCAAIAITVYFFIKLLKRKYSAK